MAAGADARRERWLIGESDYGGPIVEHVHPDGTEIAYVLFGANGREFAQCTACGDRKSLAERVSSGVQHSSRSE